MSDANGRDASSYVAFDAFDRGCDANRTISLSTEHVDSSV